MKKKKYKNFMLFKISIFLNIIIQTVLKDSCNNLLKDNKCFSNYCNLNPNTKECLVNKIFIIKNTNGDIYLSQDLDHYLIMFGTTLSNNEDRIFYGFTYGDPIWYYKNYDNDSLPLIINIGRSERKEIKNAEFYSKSFSANYLFLFGSDNSFIEIYHSEEKNHRLLIEPTNFLGEDIIIKGNPTLLKCDEHYSYFSAITSTEENPTYYNISFYKYYFKSYFINNYNLINYTIISKTHFETEIKGEYLSCDLIKTPLLISCFYLTKDNNYTIILVKEEDNKFFIKNNITVEQKEDINMEKPYFMKVALLSSDFCIYAYYSGESNDIPTFLIKTISKDYSINDKFNDFQVVNLYDYTFNNGIEYNDLATNENDEFFFISTEKDKVNIIISYIKFYLSNDNKWQMLIRYYTIPLKQNYNMKILNRLKAIYYHSDDETSSSFLILGFDFNFLEESDNLNNAGLIMFSFPNILIDDKLDFIEYAFKYNINYTIINFTDMFGIQNNIFGYNINYFILNSEDSDIEFIKNGRTIDLDNPIVKVLLKDNIFTPKNITLTIYISFSLPETVQEFNEYCNKINETFGDKNDESSYTLNKDEKFSQDINYIISINEALSNKCNVNGCDLCLGSDENYCIVCKDDNYIMIEDKKYPYGKLKICSEKKSDEITNEITGEITNEITDLNTDEKTSIMTNKITNEVTEQKTDEITNKITEKITNEIINKITEKITNEITIEITSKITSEITDEKTNEITNKITNKITEEITIEVSNEIKEILTNFITEKTTNKDTEEIINTLSDKLTNEITERISNEKIKETIIELTEKLTSELTEKKVDEKTEEITNEYIREITNKMSEKLTNKDNTNYITSNIDTEKLINDLTNKIKTTEISNNTEISFEELMNDKYKNTTLSNEEIEEIYKHIKDYITENYDGNNTIINTSNVKIQISKIDDQKDSELSNIDLGECEEILKKKYCKAENDSLIMLKFDIKPENETSTFVHYKVYSTRDKLYLELKECSGNNVIINVPIELSSEIEEIYEFLSQSGYNIFDSNSSFYNDICASFTTKNGTDILLYDRRMDIYRTTLNISLCQEGCDFKSYSVETKKATCDCYSQKKDLSIEDLSDIKFDKNQMIEDFYQTIQNSNFRVLKCYKLAFDIKIFMKNIGSIGMSVLLALFIILIIVHLTMGAKIINSFIQIIIKNKYLENKNSNILDKPTKSKGNNKTKDNKKKDLENESKNKAKNKKKRRNRFSVVYNKNIGLEKLKARAKRKQASVIIRDKSVPPKRKTSKYQSVRDEGSKTDDKFLLHKKSNNYDYNLISSKMMTLNIKDSNSRDYEFSPKARRKSKIKKLSKKMGNDLIVYNKHKGSKDSENHRLNHKRSTIIRTSKRSKTKKVTKKMRNSLIFSKDEETSTRSKNKTLEKNNLLNYDKANNLNTQELNTLKYEEALELDKRTYFQYYFSLLKKKHLILFTFLPTNDYNLMSLKIALFIVSFSMYFTIETFFFNDETMHKIYQESGVYNILTQIPQILYSSVVSSIINMILKSLSLSEKDILKIKKEKDMHSTVKMSKSIEKCIKIKSFLFFTISLLLMLFFWYFISCFCAVYYNTQIILIKNTLISFGLSMLYPVGINLIPGMFRIPALRAKKKDKKCLYSFSQFVALI